MFRNQDLDYLATFASAVLSVLPFLIVIPAEYAAEMLRNLHLVRNGESTAAFPVLFGDEDPDKIEQLGLLR